MLLAERRELGRRGAGALALGLCIGLVNGLAIDRLGIPPFIVTLAGLQGFRGLTLLVSGGMTIAGMPDALGPGGEHVGSRHPDDVRRHAVFGAASQFMLSYAARPLHVCASAATPRRRAASAST